jgi:hypothetical protein
MRPTELLAQILAVAEETGVIHEYARCPGVPVFDVWEYPDRPHVQVTVSDEVLPEAEDDGCPGPIAGHGCDACRSDQELHPERYW